MYKKLESCPICKSKKFDNEIICNDYTVSNEKFVIVKCVSCQLLFTNPRPDSKQIGKYYDSELYVSHSSKSNNLINSIYKIARHFTLRNKHNLIKKYSLENKTLLDYGSGTGHFLSFCKNKDWNVTGIEPNKVAREKANKNTKNAVLENINTIDNDTKFQIITLWHVLEHVEDLNKLLIKLTSLLNKKGTLIIAVPNPESWDAKKYKLHWAGYDVPRHLYHFSQDSIKTLMKNHKLKIKEILPMKLDSYYVSMLSEKYKNKSNNYFRAVINGYKSNRYAKKNNKNYSSLIYIIQK